MHGPFEDTLDKLRGKSQPAGLPQPPSALPEFYERKLGKQVAPPATNALDWSTVNANTAPDQQGFFAVLSEIFNNPAKWLWLLQPPAGPPR